MSLYNKRKTDRHGKSMNDAQRRAAAINYARYQLLGMKGKMQSVLNTLQTAYPTYDGLSKLEAAALRQTFRQLLMLENELKYSLLQAGYMQDARMEAYRQQKLTAQQPQPKE